MRTKRTSPATGVTPNEVHRVVDSDPRIYRVGREKTRLVFGTTYNDRYLVVVLADGLDGRDYEVTARDMTPEEKATFQRRTPS